MFETRAASRPSLRARAHLQTSQETFFGPAQRCPDLEQLTLPDLVCVYSRFVTFWFYLLFVSALVCLSESPLALKPPPPPLAHTCTTLIQHVVHTRCTCWQSVAETAIHACFTLTNFSSRFLVTGSAATTEKKIPYFFQTFPNLKFHFFQTPTVATNTQKSRTMLNRPPQFFFFFFFFFFLGNVAVFSSNKDTVCIFLFLISAARKTN